MTDSQRREIVQKEIGNIYDQLVINCRKTTGAGYDKWGDDLLAMCVEMFLEKDVDYIWKVYQDGKLENFLTFMMSFQLKSSSSRFYHRHRKFTDNSREILENYSLIQERVAHNKAFKDEPNLIGDCMEKVIAKLNPYEKMIVQEIIIDGNRYNKTSEKYNINYYSLKNDCIRIKNKIKESCKHFR